jgi:hypothetical protein
LKNFAFAKKKISHKSFKVEHNTAAARVFPCLAYIFRENFAKKQIFRKTLDENSEFGNFVYIGKQF